LVFYDISVFAELVSKSTSILLEDEGGKTSREEHCYTILLLIKLTVWCGNHHKLKASHKNAIMCKVETEQKKAVRDKSGAS